MQHTVRRRFPQALGAKNYSLSRKAKKNPGFPDTT
jgi:hypothetical protein